MISATEVIPVIVPARNEECDIADAILSLQRSIDDVLPIVVTNGCNDDTSAVAESSGAIVLESTTGKVAATQVGLEFAVNKLNASTVLFTDADTRVGRYWPRILSRSVASNDLGDGSVVTGAVRFFGEPGRCTNLLRTINMVATDIKRTITDEAPVPVRGYNYGIRLDKARKIFEAIMELDGSIFPGADVAIVEAASRAGANIVFEPNPFASVKTRGDRIESIFAELCYRLYKKSKIPPGTKFLDSYKEQYGRINPYTRQ